MHKITLTTKKKAALERRDKASKNANESAILLRSERWLIAEISRVRADTIQSTFQCN